MNKYLFMQPVLNLISEGTLFTRIFATALRTLAVFLGIGALIAWLQIWRVVFYMQGVAILAGFICQLLSVVGVYMVVHTVWIRAGNIYAIGKSDFTVLPIVSIFLRMIGEVYACASVVLGLSGGIMLLFSGSDFLYAYPNIPMLGIGWQYSLLSGLFGGNSASSFIAALIAVVSGAFGAIFWLGVSYFMSESLIVQVEIARNTRVVRNITENFRVNENEDV
jgi:hypothetical protein